MVGQWGKQKGEEGEEEGQSSKPRLTTRKLLLSSRNDLAAHEIFRGMHTHDYFNWHHYLQELLRQGDKFKSITQRPINNELLNSEVMLLIF